jgi:predicted  nucleic acid-binding Zn-ribbon protein
MEHPGIYTRWFYFRRGKVGGQVATMITLAIAVIFLFIAVTLNISKVAEKKTMTANAADGAAVKLASYLGSWGNHLSWRFFKNGGSYKEGKKNWGPAWSLLTLAVTWGSAGVGLSAAAYGYKALIEPELIRVNMQKEFNKLLPEDSIVEQAIHYAFLNSVNDPVRVADVHDYDQDGDETDEISRFDKYYFERVKMLAEDAEELRAAKITRVDGFIRQWENFIGDGDSFRQQQLTPGGKLVSVLEDIDAEGIDLSFWQPGPTEEEIQAWKDTDEESTPPEGWDEVDELDNGLEEFKEDFGHVDGLSWELKVDIGQWLTTLLYTEEAKEADDLIWYDAWKEKISKIDNWKQELNTAYAELGAMIASKEAEIVVLEDDIAVKEAQILVLEQDIATKGRDISVLRGEIGRKEGEIATKEAEILALQGEIAKKEAEIVALENEITAKEAEISAKESEIAALQSEITTKNAEISALQGEIAQKETEISVLEGEIAANEGSVTAKQNQISALRSDIAAKTADIATLESQIAANEGAIAAKETEIANLEANLAEARNDVDIGWIYITILEASITQLETEISALAQDITNKENAITAKEAEIVALNTTIAAKQAEIAALNNEITTKESNITVKQGEITTKEGNITAKQGEIANKRTAIAAKQGEITGLESVINTKEGEIRGLGNDITSKEGDITDNQNDILVLEGEIATKEGEIVVVEADIAVKAEELSGLEDEVLVKLEQVEELKKDVARLGDLQKRILVAINDLDGFQGKLTVVTNDIKGFYYQNQLAEEYEDEPEDGFYNTFKEGVYGQFPDWVEDIFESVDDFGSLLFGTKEVKGDYTVAPRWVVYSWHDSLGWHHVLVEVPGFRKPWIRVKTKKRLLYSRQKLYLEDAIGEITVRVTRYDQSTSSSFAAGAIPLWKFRYGWNTAEAGEIDHANPLEALAYDSKRGNGCKYAVSSSSTVGYAFNQLPNMVSVE